MAGWCIALAYLLCVLAPTLSFALSDSSISAPCIIEDHSPGMPGHVQDHPAHEGHDAGTKHDHAMHGHSHNGSVAETGAVVKADAALPIKAPNKTDEPRCCGLITMSAIPAADIILVKPTAMASLCTPEDYRAVSDNTPPGLYRPPIS